MNLQSSIVDMNLMAYFYIFVYGLVFPFVFSFSGTGCGVVFGVAVFTGLHVVALFQIL